jgi:RNA polymerase sigma-70 factor (ECF subfamily)
VVHEPGRLGRLPDDALLAALALGEPGAAAVFVRRFQRRVYGLAVTITGDRSLAEDVAQTAFERAWRHAGSFDARRGTVPTWLLAITRNVAIDAIRVRRPVAIDPIELADLLAPSSFDPEAVAVTNDQVLRLRKRLDALSPEQRRAVLLATVAGRSMAEIGAIEGIPVATAKTRLRDGLRRLRRTVGSEVEP